MQIELHRVSLLYAIGNGRRYQEMAGKPVLVCNSMAPKPEMQTVGGLRSLLKPSVAKLFWPKGGDRKKLRGYLE